MMHSMAIIKYLNVGISIT